MDVPGLCREDGQWQLSPETAAQFASLSLAARHLAFHRLAKALFLATGPQRSPEQGGDLVRKGFLLAPGTVPVETCRALSGRIGEWLQRDGGGAQNSVLRSSFRRDDSNRVVAVDQEVIGVMMPTIQRILRRQIVTTCEAYLGSHFKVNSFRLFRAVPTEDALVSFRWHIDAAPPGQIHVMVYLTDAGPDGLNGCTSFLPRQYFEQLNAGGYAYGSIDDRVVDLAQIDGGGVLADKVETPLPRAGDALVFAPGTLFHRGVSPRAGFRDALLLVLVPSLEPWAVNLTKHGTEKFLHRAYDYLPINSDPTVP